MRFDLSVPAKIGRRRRGRWSARNGLHLIPARRDRGRTARPFHQIVCKWLARTSVGKKCRRWGKALLLYVEEDVWLPSTLNFYRDCSRCSARRDFLHFFSAPRPPGRACGPCTQAFLSYELSRWAAAGSFGGGEARCAHGDAEHSHPRPCVTLRACLATASR